eukprot:3020254-Alexandrium_andersonii.AAC.1
MKIAATEQHSKLFQREPMAIEWQPQSFFPNARRRLERKSLVTAPDALRAKWARKRVRRSRPDGWPSKGRMCSER